MEFVKQGIRYEKINNEIIVLGVEDKNNIPEYLVIPSVVDECPVVAIKELAFATDEIKRVSLPVSLDYIGKQAFANCTNLERINFVRVHGFKEVEPMVIEIEAFWNCWQLINVITYQSRKVVLNVAAFENCYSLQEFQMLIKNIESFAFNNCKKMSKLCFTQNAMMQRDCLFGNDINTLRFVEDAYISQDVLDQIKQNNIKIECFSNSKLLNLAYEGVLIELIILPF